MGLDEEKGMRKRGEVEGERKEVQERSYEDSRFMAIRDKKERGKKKERARESI